MPEELLHTASAASYLKDTEIKGMSQSESDDPVNARTLTNIYYFQAFFPYDTIHYLKLNLAIKSKYHCCQVKNN